MGIRFPRTLSHIQAIRKLSNPRTVSGLLSNLFIAFIELLINIPVMNTVWRERREMELLSDEHIKDIGITPEMVRIEYNRSFYDIPDERKRSFNQANKRTHETACTLYL